MSARRSVPWTSNRIFGSSNSESIFTSSQDRAGRSGGGERCNLVTRALNTRRRAVRRGGAAASASPLVGFLWLLLWLSLLRPRLIARRTRRPRCRHANCRPKWLTARTATAGRGEDSRATIRFRRWGGRDP